MKAFHISEPHISTDSKTTKPTVLLPNSWFAANLANVMRPLTWQPSKWSLRFFPTVQVPQRLKCSPTAKRIGASPAALHGAHRWKYTLWGKLPLLMFGTIAHQQLFSLPIASTSYPKPSHPAAFIRILAWSLEQTHTHHTSLCALWRLTKSFCFF